MNFRLLLNSLLCSLCVIFASACHKPEGWAVYYGGATPPDDLDRYAIVILDRLYPYDIGDLKDSGVTVIGYISAGEVTVNDPWYEEAKAAGLLLSENPFWKGSFTVDIRNPLWQEILLEKAIPPLIARGFDGIMLDTLDSPLVVNVEEMKPAATALVGAIRETYPQHILIQNRGYQALEDTAPMLNYLIAESTFTGYDAETKKHILSTKADQDWIFNFINKGKKISPTLKILGLEYWDVDDVKMTAELTNKMKNKGFIPYVSTLSLNKIYPQPNQKGLAKWLKKI